MSGASRVVLYRVVDTEVAEDSVNFITAREAENCLRAMQIQRPAAKLAYDEVMLGIDEAEGFVAPLVGGGQYVYSLKQPLDTPVFVPLFRPAVEGKDEQPLSAVFVDMQRAVNYWLEQRCGMVQHMSKADALQMAMRAVKVCTWKDVRDIQQARMLRDAQNDRDIVRLGTARHA